MTASHQCKALRIVQLPVAAAFLPDAVHTPAVADPQLLHPVVVAVGDEEVRAVCREAKWIIEVARSRTRTPDAPKCGGCHRYSSSMRVQVAGAVEQYAIVARVGHGKPTTNWKTNRKLRVHLVRLFVAVRLVVAVRP